MASTTRKLLKSCVIYSINFLVNSKVCAREFSDDTGS